MRRVLAVLSVLLGTLTMGVVTASVAPTVAGATVPTTTIYDSTTGNPPSSYVYSFPFQASQSSEVGNEVTFGAGSRTLENAVVTMSSWACQSGAWYSGDCVTTPGATYNMPLTLNIYNVGPGNTVGSTIYSTTQSFAIPYRPSADAGHCGAFTDGAGGTAGSDYYDGTNCEAELASNVTFTLPHLTVPNSVVYGVAMNTSGFGAAPYGYANPCNSTAAGCFYDSLNVAMSSDPDNLSAGSDTVANSVFQSTVTAGNYCDGGTGGVGVFRLDAGCWYAQNPATGPETPAGTPTSYLPTTGPNEGLVPSVQFNAESTCTTTCYVNATTGNDTNSGQADAPFATIQHGVSTVSSGGTVLVAPGTYNENVVISQPESLLGANAAVAGTGTRTAESVISTSNPTGDDVTVDVASTGVTVAGFTITQTAPVTCASCAAFGVQVEPGASGAHVGNNIISGMSTSGSNPGVQAGNPIGVNVAGNGSSAPSNVVVAQNLIEGIASTGTQHRSALGIEIGGSSLTNPPSTNVSIALNRITGVTSQSWGAYGVITNRPTTGLQVVGNTFDTLAGGIWTHAVGLEGPTTSPVITNNAFSGITAGTADQADVFTDSTNNTTVSTATLSHNSFGAGTADGIITGSTGGLTATNNWWGCAGGPNAAGCADTAVGGGAGPITATPWIEAFTPDPAHVGGPGFWPTAIVASSAPAFTSAAAVTLHTGAVESFAVTASGTPAPVLSEAGTDTLPPGVTFHPLTGLLSGTPTALGTYSLHLTAHNGAGADATQTLVVNVVGISSAPSLQTAVGKAFSFMVTTSGNPAPALVPVGIPAWAHLTNLTHAKAGSAKLAGVAPATGGDFTFTIFANFGSGQPAAQTFTIHVLGVTSASAVNFSKSGPPTQSFTITTTGVGTTATITAGLGSKEAGLTFVDNGNGTATISGQPGPTAKTNIVKVTVTSGSSVAVQKLAIGIGN